MLLILGVGRTPFAFLPNSWGGDMVRNAGGTLLTGGRNDRGGFARISDEVVVAEDPDVIIAVPHAAAKDIPSIARYLRSNPAWSTTRRCATSASTCPPTTRCSRPAPTRAR